MKQKKIKLEDLYVPLEIKTIYKRKESKEDDETIDIDIYRPIRIPLTELLEMIKGDC